MTQAQQARWDKAVLWARDPEPVAYSLALDRSGGTGFYARDIIISEYYGTDLSWPGWGKWPDGPAAPEQPRPRGTLVDVDGVHRQSAYRNAGRLQVNIELFEPEFCKLYISTLAPQAFDKPVLREGQYVPHGLRLWLPEAQGEYTPTTGDGLVTQQFTPADVDPAADRIWWWVAQKSDAAPVVSWSSAAYPLDHTGPPPVTAWYTGSPGGISGPHGFTPDPATVAELNFIQDDLINCLTTRYNAVIDQDHREVLFTFSFGGGPPLDGSTDIPSPFSPCIDGEVRMWPAEPMGGVPYSSSATNDSYDWWIIFHLPP